MTSAAHDPAAASSKTVGRQKCDTTRHGQDGRHKAWHTKTWTRWQTQSMTHQDMDKMADTKHDTPRHGQDGRHKA